MLMGDVRAEQLMRAVEPEIRESLSPQQERAIREAAQRSSWDSHSLDLRLSCPTPFGRYYITLIGGCDRRSGARRDKDRSFRPLVTIGNIAFFASVTVIAGLTAVGILGLVSGLLGS